MHIRRVVLTVLLTSLVTVLVACTNYTTNYTINHPGGAKRHTAPQQLILEYIRLEKPATSDDKLYLNIATYSSNKQTHDYQIPEAPLHWDAKYLEQVKELVLWEQSLEADEQMDFTISLIENDTPPWNPDDLLGTVKLKLHAKNTRLYALWHADEDAVEIASHAHRVHEYILLGDHGRYRIGLRLKEKA